MNIRIGHVARDTGQYIGRAGHGRPASVLANPFRIGRDGTREEVIARYKRWLWGKIKANDDTVMAELNRLLELAKTRPEGLTLVCFCRRLGKAEPACHGDVIKSALEWMDKQETDADPVVAAAQELGGEVVW